MRGKLPKRELYLLPALAAVLVCASALAACRGRGAGELKGGGVAQARASTVARAGEAPQPARVSDGGEGAADRRPLKLPLVNPKIVVRKGARRLTLFSGGEAVREYPVALGFNPEGDKVRQGDGRTPEGTFYVCVKNERSAFHLSLGLSYPDGEDAERGLRDRLITRGQYERITRALKRKQRPPWDTPLGGEIFIHGGGAAGDWTWGCIALENDAVRELFDAVPMGTTVRIEP
jgi:hypothetical protein